MQKYRRKVLADLCTGPCSSIVIRLQKSGPQWPAQAEAHSRATGRARLPAPIPFASMPIRSRSAGRQNRKNHPASNYLPFLPAPVSYKLAAASLSPPFSMEFKGGSGRLAWLQPHPFLRNTNVRLFVLSVLPLVPLKRRYNPAEAFPACFSDTFSLRIRTARLS